MKPVAKAVVEAGLVPDETLDELARWGIHVPAQPRDDLRTPQEVVEHIREAYESDEQVRIDQTDLDLLQRYLDKSNQKSGRLILKEGKQHRTLSVTFCLTVMGEYAIPWTESEEPDILVNGETHLKWQDGDVARDVYFSDAREVFFGQRKAFVVCEPLPVELSKEEDHG